MKATMKPKHQSILLQTGSGSTQTDAYITVPSGVPFEGSQSSGNSGSYSRICQTLQPVLVLPYHLSPFYNFIKIHSYTYHPYSC